MNTTSADLHRRAIHRRAVEALIWGMPAVSFDLLYQAMVREARGTWNQIVYWSRLPDWKNQTLTPNPDTIYALPFFNTKDVGPVVLEIPPAEGGSISGTVMDGWQAALEDVGSTGVDGGKGAKYLILPPAYEDTLPRGYVPMPSDTYAGYALLRSTPATAGDADVAQAVAHAKRIKLYPYSHASVLPTTTYVDAVDCVYDCTIPHDLRFFQALDRFVQAEPWLERDKAMIDQLKAIGIEKGRPFRPDARTRAVLEEAAREAHAWLELRYEGIFSAPYFESTHWALPASPEVVDGQATFFERPDVYPVDDRGVTFSFAFFSSKHLGGGQLHLMAIKDGAGRAFDGGCTYRLSVPANVPARSYWSVTIYDRRTHALIRELPSSSRSSRTPGLVSNPDGSVDIHFGPKAPVGRESNWIPTRPGGIFEVVFRVYGPEEPLFDKTWRLPDIERTRETGVTARESGHPASGVVPAE